MKRTLDIVTSVLNEELCINELFTRISNTLSKYPDFQWRLIICDNGSTDTSWLIIKELATKHPNVLGIRMSRTFSLDAAFTCGIDLAEADALVIMASDLQDPPEMIAKFISGLEAFDVVMAERVSRNDSILKKFSASVFYGILGNLSEGVIRSNIGDFWALSERAKNNLLK